MTLTAISVSVTSNFSQLQITFNIVVQITDEITGIAPDIDENCYFYMTSTRNVSLIDKLYISELTGSSNKRVSRIKFGGYEQSGMPPFTTASDPDYYWYDNKYDDKKWGLKIIYTNSIIRRIGR